MNASTSDIVDLGQLSPLARLLVEQAIVMADELQAVADKAPKGEVFHHCEEAAIERGREFTRLALQKTAQEYLAAHEKKRLFGPVRAAAPAATAAPTSERFSRRRAL
jgi:hypothetical protein